MTNFALFFHELATNAAKYGALSVPEGRLQIDLERNDNALTLRWLEQNRANQTRASAHVGFGTRLEQTVAKSLGAEVEREWQSDGLCVTVTITPAQP